MCWLHMEFRSNFDQSELRRKSQWEFKSYQIYLIQSNSICSVPLDVTAGHLHTPYIYLHITVCHTLYFKKDVLLQAALFVLLPFLPPKRHTVHITWFSPFVFCLANKTFVYIL
jgi:hypothetical protein